MIDGYYFKNRNPFYFLIILTKYLKSSRPAAPHKIESNSGNQLCKIILEFWEKRDLNSRNEGSGRLENELLRPQNELSNLKGGCHKQPPHHTIKRSPTSGKSTQPPTTRGFPSPMIILLDTTDICPWMSFHLCLKGGRMTETRLTHGSRPKIQLWWFEKRQ